MKTRTNQPVFYDNGRPVVDDNLSKTKWFIHNITLEGNESTGEINGGVRIICNNPYPFFDEITLTESDCASLVAGDTILLLEQDAVLMPYVVVDTNGDNFSSSGSLELGGSTSDDGEEPPHNLYDIYVISNDGYNPLYINIIANAQDEREAVGVKIKDLVMEL